MNLKNRPYLEVKVVKVKKYEYIERKIEKLKRRIKYLERAMAFDLGGAWKYVVLEKQKCGKEIAELKAERVYKKGKGTGGNWVNGENLDKIKFPCWCSYFCNGQRWLGEINRTWISGEGTKYYLSSLNGQKDYSIVTIIGLLKELIEGYDIHILKGKIILFEEDTNEKYDIDIEGE